MTTVSASVPEFILSPGERIILSQRASLWIIILRPAAWYILMLLALAAAWAARHGFFTDLWGLFAGLWFTVLFLRLVWDVLDWALRRHILTDRRIVRASGVLRRTMADLPLSNIEYLAIDRSLRQRWIDVGTLAAGTKGIGIPEILWLYVPRCQVVMENVRRAFEASRGGQVAERLPPVTVIGLVGGIGSGKSTVAAELASLGCTVVDSDLAAREILLRPAVRDELVRWWGAGILSDIGQVDRKKVAGIVFADSTQRARLEALVHPLIRDERSRVVERIGRAGGGIVVIDAPLLFEAGVDRECDAVVFVDVSRQIRADRVRARGWDDGELDRREAAQMPLDEKRRRSQFIIINDGDRTALHAQVRDLMERWRRAAPSRTSM
ncbi:MAG: dephospho-CoA kinase [Phycisphaerales bacterium]|nr:dephospho-CoA kinase [Phycisphaerales bacterium]